MLGSLRKVQKSLLIVVTTIICIAFAYLYVEYDTGATASGTPSVALTIDGRPYPGSEAYRLANLFNVAFRDLGISAPFNIQPLGRFAMDMLGEGGGMALFNPNVDRTDFVINLLVFREAARKLGFVATDEQVQEAIEAIPFFQNEAGTFDPALYRRYLRDGLGRFALYEFDLRELIADFVAYGKIQELTASTLAPTDWETGLAYEDRHEVFTAYEIFLPGEPLLKDLAITDEMILSYHEENKSQLLSPPKRSLRYLVFPIPPKAEDEGDDQWQARRNTEAARFKEAFRLLREGIEEKGQTLAQAVETVLAADGFQEMKVLETAPFAAASPPEELVGETDLLQRAFLLDEGDANAYDTVSSDKAIYLYWLKEPPIPPTELTMEEARDQIVERLTAQETDSRLRTHAGEVRTKLAEALGKGQTILDAAAAAGVEAIPVKPFESSQTPEGSARGAEVRNLALTMVRGELSEPSILPDGALLVYLWARDVPERESEPEDRKRISDSLRTALAARSFDAWLEARRSQADIKRPQIKDRDGNSLPMSIEYFAPRR